jgi:hypothetical protein
MLLTGPDLSALNYFLQGVFLVALSVGLFLAGTFGLRRFLR